MELSQRLEVFEKEYEDINEYKGKQTKEMEMGRTRSKLCKVFPPFFYCVCLT